MKRNLGQIDNFRTELSNRCLKLGYTPIRNVFSFRRVVRGIVDLCINSGLRLLKGDEKLLAAFVIHEISLPRTSDGLFGTGQLQFVIKPKRIGSK